MKARNSFLEQLKARQARATAPAEAPPPEKPPEQMTAEELDLALVRAQRELLDLRHQELRERELGRIQQSPGEASGPRTLADALREAKKNRRRRRR